MSGCGCRNKGTSTAQQVAAEKRENKVKKEPTVVVLSENSPAPKTVKRGVCDQLYSELSILDGKVYDLFKRVRMDGSGDDYEWLQVQRRIREWKVGLNDKCPDELELNVVRSLVNEEYAKLFTS